MNSNGGGTEMTKNRVQFRAPDELVEHVEAVADALDVSKSEAWREATRRGLADVADDAEGLEHVAFENRIDTIKREIKPQQKEAWFRNNASKHLLKCWNGGLTPEEARKSMGGYLRAATEEYGREDYREYVEEGLSLYADAHSRSNAHIIVDWCKQRANADRFDDDTPGAIEAEGVIPDDETTETETEQRSKEERIEDAAEMVEKGIWELDFVDEEIRDEVRDRVEGDDGN